ncbi:MAG TPA: hypothetical protein VGE52_20645 [Pirellulales bacterium]
MLALTLLTAVLLSANLSPYWSKERAIARLERLGAHLLFEVRFRHAIVLTDRGRSTGDSWRRTVFGEHHAADVVHVELVSFKGMTPRNFTDADAVLLAALPTLQSVILRDTQLTDAGLMKLVSLRFLRELDLQGSRVTAAGVAKFRAERPTVKVTSSASP